MALTVSYVERLSRLKELDDRLGGGSHQADEGRDIPLRLMHWNDDLRPDHKDSPSCLFRSMTKVLPIGRKAKSIIPKSFISGMKSVSPG